jgi:hypothetical protein
MAKGAEKTPEYGIASEAAVGYLDQPNQRSDESPNNKCHRIAIITQLDCQHGFRVGFLDLRWFQEC